MKAFEQYFPVVLFIVVHDGSNSWVCGWNPSVTIQMKAIGQYFPVVLFIMLYKVVLTFEPVEEILKCDYSSESYWAVVLLIVVLALGRERYFCYWWSAMMSARYVGLVRTSLIKERSSAFSACTDTVSISGDWSSSTSRFLFPAVELNGAQLHDTKVTQQHEVPDPASMRSLTFDVTRMYVLAARFGNGEWRMGNGEWGKGLSIYEIGNLYDRESLKAGTCKVGNVLRRFICKQSSKFFYCGFRLSVNGVICRVRCHSWLIALRGKMPHAFKFQLLKIPHFKDSLPPNLRRPGKQQITDLKLHNYKAGCQFETIKISNIFGGTWPVHADKWTPQAY